MQRSKADELGLREKELQVKAAQAADEMKQKAEIEGMRLGIDIGKSRDKLKGR
jgi:hypothetical protein